MIMKEKEKVCLKFTGYIYMPRSNADNLRNYSARTSGRLIVYDENNEFKEGKAYAFDNLGDMLNQIEKARKRRILKRVKK